MSDRYPLEAARTVRERDRELAQAKLAHAIAAREAAQTEQTAARARLLAFRESENERRERGAETCRAAELRRLAEYDLRQRDQEALLRARLSRASAALSAARAQVRECERSLRDAHASREVVERHRERWKDERRRDAERAADDELDEIASARRSE